MSYLEKKISTTDKSQASLINKSRKKKKGKPKLTLSEKKEDSHIIREIITTYIQLSAFFEKQINKSDLRRYYEKDIYS